MPPRKRPKTTVTSNGDHRCAWKERFKGLTANDPVLVVDLRETANDDAPSIPDLNVASSDSLFADMIFPMPPNVFMEHCFRRKAVHFHAKQGEEPSSSLSQRVEPIVRAMSNLDPASILQETSSDNIFVWIPQESNEHHPHDNGGSKPRIQSVEIDSVETALALYRAGCALYFRASPDVEQPMVAAMLRGTGMGCGNYDPSGNSSVCMGRGEVEVFMSCGNSNGSNCHMSSSHHMTDWHFDFQENFTVQLSGVKKWTLQQGTVKHPLRACTPHYMTTSDVVESQLKAAHLADDKFEFGKSPQEGVNAVGKAVEVIVQPGDVLYFPAGMWHRVETMEPGVSINVSLMATNYATLVTQALQHYLLTKDEWRQSVVLSNNDDNSHLEMLLRQLPSDIERLASQMNFSGQILPPVLLDPPKLELVADGDNDGEAEQAPINSQNGGTDGDVTSMVALEENDQGLLRDDDRELVVDVNAFELPAEALRRLSTLNRSGKLVVSRLASLLRMDDIESSNNDHDKENADSSSSTPAQPLYYVVNVNYAGNEMHESAVRVVLTDAQGHLDHVVDGSHLRDEDIVCSGGVHEPWHMCLLYYGFFAWLPQM